MINEENEVKTLVCGRDRGTVTQKGSSNVLESHVCTITEQTTQEERGGGGGGRGGAGGAVPLPSSLFL